MENTSHPAPISCSGIDHYTLIVPNAKKVSDFHQRVLGYRLLNTILVNAGSVPKGQYDMLNYVLSWPNSDSSVLVVTEGLTEDSIFHQFMLKFGSGIHHIAFEIEDIAAAFEQLKQKGIKVTSDKVLRDPLSGLKQFFISNEYVGVFIELIERKSETDAKETEEQGFFTQDNMSGLADTMKAYLDRNIRQDSLVRPLDTQEYYTDGETLEIDTISSVELFADKVEAAKSFLNQVFAFEYNQGWMVNPNESDKRFLITDSASNPSQKLPARLSLKAKDMSHSAKTLTSLGLPFQINAQEILLDEDVVGYPLVLKHEPA